MMKRPIHKRKCVLVFGYEGKNNKTEKQYFSHFSLSDSEFILISFSTGVTDPRKMIASTKRKRARFDYRADEDKTYIFIDGDDDHDKMKLIESLRAKLKKHDKDITLIISNPCFELWFLNHFERFGHPLTKKHLFSTLNGFIPHYEKTMDVFQLTRKNMKKAIANSAFQLSLANDNPKTEVALLLTDKVIKEKQ